MEVQAIASERYGSSSDEVLFIAGSDGILKTVDQNRRQNSMMIYLKTFFQSAFLPQGYPNSVSEDYLEYQLWDTLQAFCSSITGTLATQAVLKGYGVGDQTATVAAAAITWMLKDGTGMVGRIIFAWLKGTQLDCDAKRWRLFADVLNDIAILLDLIAPIFKTYFILLACISSIARSIVGVAGGATRAALTLHQARRDNMADVSAKDGSQETLVNLLALIAGFIITPLVANNQMLVWVLFFIFTFLHLFANYRAVCAVVMETINLPRMYLLMNHYLNHKEILTPKQLSKLDPVLRSPGYSFSISPGARLGSVVERCEDLKNTVDSHSNSLMYLVGFNKEKRTINIVFHENAADCDIRRSCFHALLLDIVVNKAEVNNMSNEKESLLEPAALVKETGNVIDQVYPAFERGLVSNGWDLKICHLGVDEWRSQWKKKMD